jgi:hypothetical protein
MGPWEIAFSVLPSLGPAISVCIFELICALLKNQKNIYIYSHGGICFFFYNGFSRACAAGPFCAVSEN